MGRKSQKLFYELFVQDEDGNITPWDSLTEEEKDVCRQRASERLGKTMSEYYSHHLDEFLELESDE